MAWEEIMGSVEKVTSIVTNALRHVGLFPFDPNEVDFTWLVAALDSIEKEIKMRNECQPYTQSGSGIVKNETVIEPDDVPRRPVEVPNAPRRVAEAPNAPRRVAEAPNATRTEVEAPNVPTGGTDVPKQLTVGIKTPQPSTSAMDSSQPSTSTMDNPQPPTSAMKMLHGIRSVTSSAVEPA